MKNYYTCLQLKMRKPIKTKQLKLFSSFPKAPQDLAKKFLLYKKTIFFLLLNMHSATK
jgi:hypothetical protein